MTTNPQTSERGLTINRLVSADGTTTLVCHGRITTDTASIFKSEVKSVSAGQLYLLVELSDVDFVDSSGLGEVVAAYISAKAAGCELKLINVHPRVNDLLNMTRLASVLREAAS